MDAFRRRVIIPDTQIKLRQGHGRGIRSETDTCVIAILDIRMAESRPYHRVMLAALPECRKTSDMAVVEAFYHEKKQPAYFSESGLNIYNEQGRI
jgi:ATP-dependent DNA helicase DinG